MTRGQAGLYAGFGIIGALTERLVGNTTASDLLACP